MKILRILIALVLVPFFSNAQESEELKRLFNEIDEIRDLGEIDYENTISSGNHPETYLYETVELGIEKAEKYEEKILELKALNLVDRQDQISRDIMVYRLTNSVDNVKYKTYLMPFNSEGGFYSRPVYSLPRLPFNNVEDYETYLAWLPSFTDYLKYNQELLAQGIQENIMRPKVIVENNLKLMEPWITNDFLNHPFGKPFANMPSDMSELDKDMLMKKGRTMVMGQIQPAYVNLYTFFKGTYLPASPAKEGISEITNGKAYYENRVIHFTTLNITPDSVFNLGQAEVTRIRKAMDKIIKDLQFQGDFAAFLEFLRTDPQFYAKTPQELLDKASWLSKKAEGQLPPLFSDLYSLPFTVAPVPDAIAPNYTGGRYVPGSRKYNRPGTYWVNTYDLPSRTLYTLPALTVHEAVPGHHLGMAMAEKLQGVPDFRKTFYISAYGEGWGLYSEYLGEEMGMYSTPYELFGRYTYEMWRACRLVVDVGMHYKGWSRKEAVDFLASNTALSLHEVNTEIDRYIGWPGQALSYKVGELTIKQLRAEATEALGDDFDIQKFHAAILENGSVPLPILRQEVEVYIDSEKE